MILNILIGVAILLWNIAIVYQHIRKNKITKWTLFNSFAIGVLTWALIIKIF
jgi:hypothetical protein